MNALTPIPTGACQTKASLTHLARASRALSEPQRAIIAAMFHRTRREWLEWGPAEIARRVKRTADDISRDLRDLSAMGLIVGKPAKVSNGCGFTGWRATEIGKKVVSA